MDSAILLPLIEVAPVPLLVKIAQLNKTYNRLAQIRLYRYKRIFGDVLRRKLIRRRSIVEPGYHYCGNMFMFTRPIIAPDGGPVYKCVGSIPTQLNLNLRGITIWVTEPCQLWLLFIKPCLEDFGTRCVAPNDFKKIGEYYVATFLVGMRFYTWARYDERTVFRAQVGDSDEFCAVHKLIAHFGVFKQK